MRAGIQFVMLVALYCTSQAWAQNNVWESGISDDGTYVYAVTAHTSMLGIGQYCYVDSGNCIYAMVQDAKCDKDEKYPALINSDVSASHHMLMCVGPAPGLSRRYLYMFDNFDAIDAIVRSGTTMGIATPMVNGQFQVIRFSLRGSIRAINSLEAFYRQLVSKHRKSNKNHALPVHESI